MTLKNARRKSRTAANRPRAGIFEDQTNDQETENNMKIAISASGKDLDSPIDARFGRCAHFIVVGNRRHEPHDF